MTQTDIVSSIGVALILLAFALSTFKQISSESRIYFVINLLGGAMACWGSILLKSIPFTVLEIIWTIVALVGLVRTMK